MSLTTGDQSRYRDFRSHYLPRTAKGRASVFLFIAALAFAEWPLLPLANRIEPTLFGFPFLFTYLTVIYAIKLAVLIYAARNRL